MSRVDKFTGKWKKHTSDTMVLAEDKLKKSLENREWYDEIKGARELIDKAGMENVGVVLTHEGFILLQKVMEDSMQKVIKDELPDLIRLAVREELTAMLEANRQETPSPDKKTAPPKKRKYTRSEVSKQDRDDGFRVFKSPEDIPLVVGIIKEQTASQGSVSNKSLRFLMELEYKVVIKSNMSSQIINLCMKKDGNIEKVSRGLYRYKS